MAQINKEQLKNIINKEFVYVMKEAKRNDAYFNQIAYEYLIEEGVIEENWQDRAVQRQVAAWEREDAEKRNPQPGPGESFADTRSRLGMPHLADPKRHNLTTDQVAGVEELAAQDAERMSSYGAGSRGGEGQTDPKEIRDMPTDLAGILKNLKSNAAMSIQPSLEPIGKDIWKALSTKAKGLPKNTMASITIDIIKAIMHRTKRTGAGGVSYEAGVRGKGGPALFEDPPIGVEEEFIVEVQKRLLGK